MTPIVAGCAQGDVRPSQPCLCKVFEESVCQPV